MTPTELKARFRRDVDDIQHDPGDESDLLFTNEDIDFYMDEAHRTFVAESKYLHERITASVTSGSATVDLPSRFLELRGDTAYLQTLDRKIPELNHSEAGAIDDDYGVSIPRNRIFNDGTTGAPQAFTLDAESNKLTLMPTPDADDTIEFLAYMEPEPPSETDVFAMDNPRHIVMLLDGMKMLAYRKQDADVYDPRQGDRWESSFLQSIEQVSSERKRRRRKPGMVRYGGL